MDIGFYALKQQLRQRLQVLMPYVKGLPPQWISLSLIPIGLLTAWIYAEAASAPWMYLLGLLGLALRFAVSNLDRMVAEETGQKTDRGALFHRLGCEFADISLMLAIASTAGENSDLAIWALAIGWASSYLGMSSLIVGKPIQHAGPVGQFDRLLALGACSLLSSLFKHDLWMELFLWWCIFGGLVTCCLRFMKQLEEEPSREA